MKQPFPYRKGTSLKIHKLATTLAAVAATAASLMAGAGIASAISYEQPNVESCKHQFPNATSLCEYIDGIRAQAEEALRQGNHEVAEALQAEIKNALLLLHNDGKTPIPTPHQAV
ncbi:hypothetical protein NMK91_04240 [Corynebacterium pseudotuberculosis]|uniref:hypothetical protein n=1 Tax=Corynebacterium pseudotuberculosis TaxID=1719 RepID=UPI000518A684|nr:hypothetical protein [Corynebacterium pseudotuberculosis]AKS13171.1 Hypothetical protein CpE19_0832 [Corynebacterium pseudotuberculosis]UTO25262.1 hypothetical protein NMK91_04240 [Corynebacterium pseudotuberculosis]VTQ81992.1 Uncharacterised protein [Corynebacterium pseudotuberculosis]